MQASPQEVVIRDLEGRSSLVVLDRDRITLGRSSAANLCYPDDIGLSRQHLALTRLGGEWTVEDLGSKNGTLLNGARVEKPTPFRPGDKIAAGHLTIEFAGAGASEERTVVFVDNDEQFSTSATTVVASLDGVLGPQAAGAEAVDPGKTHIMQGNPQMWALIRAGRELAGHRPLAELFEVIMDLSMEAVMAGRGVLMTVEGDNLKVRAARGEGFQISRTVRDRVLTEKASLLVRDAQLDQGLREHMSIVEQKVRSILAVPLQTSDRVIGLIYLDSPNQIREFSREDLNLLTVMANVAAIRIEHARLNEIEEAERIMAKEMEQAAVIQQRLLPAKPPVVPGLDIGAKATASRAVGGDYYDFIPFPDHRVCLMVGDVAGKGMPAALLMSSLQARVHVVLDDPDHLAEKMARLNRSTCSNCPDNRFITFFMGVLNAQTGELVYTSAGHNPPVVVRAKGGWEVLPGGGVILGILPNAAYQEGHATLEPGDVLVLFSDGVTEAASPQDEEFGEQRLAELVASLQDRPAAELVEDIHKAVHEFTQGAPPADDITVVVARRLRLQ
jgi:serine phosphatase RsbU (regulator of sigma subunit)/pSer/pThr/pTyr-binding forkhead associated (FHA) protein